MYKMPSQLPNIYTFDIPIVSQYETRLLMHLTNYFHYIFYPQMLIREFKNPIYSFTSLKIRLNFAILLGATQGEI